MPSPPRGPITADDNRKVTAFSQSRYAAGFRINILEKASRFVFDNDRDTALLKMVIQDFQRFSDSLGIGLCDQCRHPEFDCVIHAFVCRLRRTQPAGELQPMPAAPLPPSML